MTQRDRPILIAYEGELEGERWVLDKKHMTIGRSVDCDIVLPKRQVSRYHARIERDDGGYLLRDLGSKNGTYVNAKRINNARLKAEDWVQFGPFAALLEEVEEQDVNLAITVNERIGLIRTSGWPTHLFGETEEWTWRYHNNCLRWVSLINLIHHKLEASQPPDVAGALSLWG